MRTLYDIPQGLQTRALTTGDGHAIHLEVSGSDKGIPVVALHGGPGSGAKPHHHGYFDPKRYRVVIFDQRGAGRSQPTGSLEANTIWELVADMERIRKVLEIDRWLLYGGSWGATLALAYALHHPRQVLGMILRGTFLARAADLEWFVGEGGVARLFPDHWQRFLETFPVKERARPMQACIHHLLEGDNAAMRVRVARAWAAWSLQVVSSSLPADAMEEEAEEDEAALLSRTGIEMHYASHGYFLEENQILAQARRLPRVPAILLHGRRDLVCTLSASWALHRALPGSELVVVPDCGHLSSEPAMMDALLQATDRMAKQLT